MATREFLDAAGERWLVWDTRPTTRARLNPAFETGWLTFECGRQLRRLAPAPIGWESLPDHELERLCRTSTPVARRHTGLNVTRLDEPPASPGEARA